MSTRKLVGATARAGMAAVALVGALFVMTSPASATSSASAPAAPETSASAPVPASWDCYDYVFNGDRWSAWCQVHSGQMRTVTFCVDGRVRTGAWIYARFDAWYVYGDCLNGWVDYVVEEPRPGTLAESRLGG